MKKLTFVFGTYRFRIKDVWLEYRNPYGKAFRVLKSDIESVSIDQTKRGGGHLMINGKGTLLAQVDLPLTWARKAQEFILEDIGKI